ncbi:hypothetical protein T4A_6233 [Trichinella pseudospiralis]|uniref:Uncharacterized protein n=1 Tax=Trichinella pseudospiralis TaxID=6337 RepID=A0A0V1F163_TRIPS|nr:hypothetical protein T4A_6233 [Trichinella pseudospiralis]
MNILTIKKATTCLPDFFLKWELLAQRIRRPVNNNAVCSSTCTMHRIDTDAIKMDTRFTLNGKTKDNKQKDN